MALDAISVDAKAGTLKAMGKIPNLTNDIKQGIKRAWFATGKDLMKEARQQVRLRKSGKKYKSLRFRSSAPGESHRNQSGTLMRSLGYKIHGHESMTFGYGVEGNKAPDYAIFMEHGTPRGQMKPRPTLQNTVNATSRNITVNLTDEINKSVEI